MALDQWRAVDGGLSLSLSCGLALAGACFGIEWLYRAKLGESETESESAQAPNTTGCIRREPEERLGTRQTVRLLDGRG